MDEPSMPVHSGRMVTSVLRPGPRSAATSAVISLVMDAMGRGSSTSWPQSTRPEAASTTMDAPALSPGWAAAVGTTHISNTNTAVSVRFIPHHLAVSMRPQRGCYHR